MLVNAVAKGCNHEEEVDAGTFVDDLVSHVPYALKSQCNSNGEEG